MIRENRQGKLNDMLRYCVEQPGNAQSEDLIATNIYSSVGSEDEMSTMPQKSDSEDDCILPPHIIQKKGCLVRKSSVSSQVRAGQDSTTVSDNDVVLPLMSESAEPRISTLHLDEQQSKPGRALTSVSCKRSCECETIDKR